MSELKEVILKEIPGFREVGHKFLKGEISKMEFKGISGGFGVYAHRDGKTFMIRLRVSSGVMSVAQLKTIYEFARKYNLPQIHLTTRQAIQLHGLNIDEVCDLMEEALYKDIFTRGGGGNYPRNVGLSPLSGVDPNEVFDVTPYALAAEKHFIKRIYEYKLPRKLKVSFSSGNDDKAHCTVQDLGFVATMKNNKKFFRVFFGGGLGKNPKVAIELDDLIEPKDMLYHLEAMIGLFMNEGDYENKHRARVRYIVDKLGEDGFVNEYKKYLNNAKESKKLDLEIDEINYEKDGIEIDIENRRLYHQKQKGLYSVYIHPIGGQLRLDGLEAIIEELEKVSNSMIRLTTTEGLFVLNLNGEEAKRILHISENFSGKNLLEESVACIGVPICQMGILRSQHLLEAIVEHFRENNFIEDILPKIHISGCPNSCGVHQIGTIGFTGKIKRIENIPTNVFEMHVGGKFEVGKSKLGKIYGDIPEDLIPRMLLEIAEILRDENIDFYQWAVEDTKLMSIVDKYNV